MANIRIAMINANTVLTDDQVQAAVPAVQTQVHRDFAPPWEINAGQNFVPSGASPDPRLRCLRARQDQAGALGYHDVTDQGFLLARCSPAVRQPVAVTASHEHGSRSLPSGDQTDRPRPAELTGEHAVRLRSV
jgi:hypothetical protein